MIEILFRHKLNFLLRSEKKKARFNYLADVFFVLQFSPLN